MASNASVGLVVACAAARLSPSTFWVIILNVDAGLRKEDVLRDKEAKILWARFGFAFIALYVRFISVMGEGPRKIRTLHVYNGRTAKLCWDLDGKPPGLQETWHQTSATNPL